MRCPLFETVAGNLSPLCFSFSGTCYVHLQIRLVKIQKEADQLNSVVSKKKKNKRSFFMRNAVMTKKALEVQEVQFATDEAKRSIEKPPPPPQRPAQPCG